jgi:hypothetical protein
MGCNGEDTTNLRRGEYGELCLGRRTKGPQKWREIENGKCLSFGLVQAETSLTKFADDALKGRGPAKFCIINGEENDR